MLFISPGLVRRPRVLLKYWLCSIPILVFKISPSIGLTSRNALPRILQLLRSLSLALLISCTGLARSDAISSMGCAQSPLLPFTGIAGCWLIAVKGMPRSPPTSTPRFFQLATSRFSPTVMYLPKSKRELIRAE